MWYYGLDIMMYLGLFQDINFKYVLKNKWLHEWRILFCW